MDTINEVNRPSISALLDSLEDDDAFNTNRKPPKMANEMDMQVAELEMNNEGDGSDNIFRDFLAEPQGQPQQQPRQELPEEPELPDEL